MTFVFEWNHQKALENSKKHRVSFEDAVSVFSDPLSLTIRDPLHSTDEERFIIVGESGRQLIVVVFTERQQRIRIISARRATARERKIYEEKN
jgi:uncharacterized protein